MKLVLEVCDSYCCTNEFKINGRDADYRDFGVMIDESSAEAPDYGCGDRQFIRQEPQKEILETYGISESEYNNICDELQRELSFGYCTLCV